jgi:hypothetical protein
VTDQDPFRPPVKKTAEGITRLGEPAGRGTAASFRCAACGEMAGVVRVIRAGAPVDMGPRLGLQAHDHDGLVLDYFLGTAWLSAGSGMLDAVQALIEQGEIDPEAIRELGRDLWELTPFYCPDCQLNYCSGDWDTRVLTDDGFYDCTRGRCPNGHEHLLDD